MEEELAGSLHPLKSLASQTQGQTNEEGGNRQLKEAEDTERNKRQENEKEVENEQGWMGELTVERPPAQK